MAQTDRPARRARRITRLRVVRTEWLTPHMVRVVAGGSGFVDFVNNEFTDRYVKLLFLTPGVEYPNPMDIAEVRASMPREHWPVTRTYTVRYVDVAAGEIAIDFVVHGDEGLAAPWAATAEPGDDVCFFGPSGAYAPSPDADWHLLAGDEAALPAIASALEAMPGGRPVHALIDVADASEEQPLITAGDATITWLHRDGAPPGDVSRLIDAVKRAPWLPGRAHVFVHGESRLVKGLRRYFIDERGVEPELLSLSGYWRTGLIEDEFQAWKKTDAAREITSGRR
jgi:NADPH-dependent ferric siderophore reductase